MDGTKENRKRLWHSLDMAYVRLQLILCAALWILFVVMYSFRFSDEYRAMMHGVLALVILPFMGFYLWRAIRIFLHTDEYSFCRCRLTNPRHDPLSKGMGFVVLIEDPEGGTVVKRTNPIFFTHGLGVPLLEDYINQTVTIGYNRETGAVVVIG